jgi:hypothetical protein
MALPILLVLVWSAGAPAPLTASDAALEVGERDPAVLLVVTPKGAAPARNEDLLQVASRILESSTNLALELPSGSAELERCAGAERLRCWVHAVRPDSPDGGVEPNGGASRRGRRSSPRFLFVLAVHPDPSGQDHLSAMLIDTDAALARESRVSHADEGWQQHVENLIFEDAVQGEPGVGKLSAPQSLDGYFRRLFLELFRPALEAAGHWQPYGAIALESEQEGARIELDGRLLGVTRKGRLELRSINPGPRTLVVTGPAPTAALGQAAPPARFEQQVEVERGTIAEVRIRFGGALLAGTGSPWIAPARATTLYGGAGLGVAGAVLLGFAVAHSGGPYALRICRGACGSAAKPEFLGLCDLTSHDPACPLGSGGVLMAPLGYALLGAGAVFSLGTLLEDDDQLPWLPAAAGIALGAAAYAISAAANGSPPR